MLKKVKRHEIPESDGINMTPMMDVVFQLLVFFILTASIATPTQIEVQLPESTSGVKAAPEKRVVVAYRQREGKTTILLNDQPMDNLEFLGRSLRRMGTGGVRKPVDIQIDRDVPYQDVIALIDTVRDAGFARFSLLTLAKMTPLSKEP